MDTRMTRAYLEKMGDTVSKQLGNKKEKENESIDNHHPLRVLLVSQSNENVKFEPQTPSQKKFYGELAHKEDISDYVESLCGDNQYRDVPAKEGIYQLCINNGLFSHKQHSPEEIERRKEKLFDEYMQSEDETYKAFSNFQSKL